MNRVSVTWLMDFANSVAKIKEKLAKGKGTIMQAEELIQIVTKIQHFKCEFQSIEVKAAEAGCPTRLYDTLSAFSNQDEGGVIVFGLDEKKRFEAVG